MARSVTMRKTGALRSVIAIATMVAPLFGGCAVRGIGDPCVPEVIPTDPDGAGPLPPGFDPREVYVETSSVQCRTRTCMVFHLQGNPQYVLEERTDECATREDCVSRDAEISSPTSEQRVFCSCRCSAAGGEANTPLCACTNGFHCVEVVTSGSAGLRGGYCIPNELCENNADCPGGTCEASTGVCVFPG
jgi:hypothetical protein